MSPPPAPTPADLATLAEKYARLAQLRAVRDGPTPDATTRQPLRELSQRHPGCLRELDTLGPTELARRAASARAAAQGGPAEPWMAYVLTFHRLMAAALGVKGGTATPPTTLAELELTDDLLQRFRRPPGGRLTPLVLAEVARRFGRPAAEVQQLLFPSRRAR